MGSNPTYSASFAVWPSNDTNLSLAGVLKWIAILAGCVFGYYGYRGVFLHEAEAGRYGPILTGAVAARRGWNDFGWAAFLFAVAWALWFFWQRNED